VRARRRPDAAPRSSVDPLSRDNVTHPAARIRDVARAARNQMQVTVEYRLPRCASGVGADVESLDGRVALEYERTGLAHERVARKHFLPGKIEPVDRVAARDHERVELDHGIGIPERVCERVLQEGPPGPRVTE